MRATLQKINGSIFVDFSLTREEMVAISEGIVISEEIELQGPVTATLNIGIKSDVYIDGDIGENQGISEGFSA